MVVLPITNNTGGSGSSEDSSSSPTLSGKISNKNVQNRARPRPPALWSIQDVVQWCQRHCGSLGALYSHLFSENNVNGRALLRMNFSALERMGVNVAQHQEEIFREILKLKLKSDILELQDLERQINTNSNTNNIPNSENHPITPKK